MRVRVRMEKGKDYLIEQNKVVKVTEYKASGDIEIQDVLNRSDTFSGIRKIDKYRYEVIDTQEIKFYRVGGNKSKEGLRRSMKKLNQILKNNFVGAENELFITLTTERDVTNLGEMKAKFQQWWMRMKKIYEDLEFVAVLEKHQDRNSWHIHTMIKATEHKKLYIPNNFIEEVWGYGYTKTSRITNVPTSNDINEDYKMAYKDKITERFGIDKVINYMCKTKTKEQIPPGERCYTTSKGIKKPISKRIKYSETKAQMANKYRLKNQYTSLIKEERTDAIVNKVKTELWTKKK